MLLIFEQFIYSLKSQVIHNAKRCGSHAKRGTTQNVIDATLSAETILSMTSICFVSL